jgi:sortase B
MLYPILAAVFAAAFIVFGYFLVKDLVPRIKNMRQIKQLQTMSPIQQAAETANSLVPDIPQSFELLHQINPDIRAWIFIEGTRVNFPVVQASNNSYYLYVSYNDEYNSAGSIFMDCANDSAFTDQNTVIYGHAMLDGTMFASLSRYKNQSFYEAHPLIMITTETGETYYYQVFSVNILEAAYNYRQSAYGSSDFTALIEYLRAHSLIASNAAVDADSRIITLSTCTDAIENGRLVIFGVLLNPDGNPLDGEIRP